MTLPIIHIYMSYIIYLCWMKLDNCHICIFFNAMLIVSHLKDRLLWSTFQVHLNFLNLAIKSQLQSYFPREIVKPWRSKFRSTIYAKSNLFCSTIFSIYVSHVFTFLTSFSTYLPHQNNPGIVKNLPHQNNPT